MCPYERPEESRVSVVQCNAELRRAQLERLSAHCATHQLRLHDSADDLGRFGRKDLLRKSAEAANPLSAFYAAVEKRILAGLLRWRLPARLLLLQARRSRQP
jgi:hypothetical protein